MLPGISSMVSA